MITPSGPDGSSASGEPSRVLGATGSVSADLTHRALVNGVRAALLQEDLLDRRWARRRDQLLTITGLIAVGASVVIGSPELAGAGLLPAAPRATRWVLDLGAARRSGSNVQHPR